MRVEYQASITKEKVTFFLGLGLVISLLYVSVLRQQHLAAHEIALVLSLTLALLVFDYLKVGQFLSRVGEGKNARYTHEHAIQSALIAVLRFPTLVKLLRIELLTLYYAFFAKSEHGEVITEHDQFSYARSSNAHDVFLFVALSQLPFLPFIHVIIETKKGPGPAWVVSFLTLWSVIWFLAQVEAVRFRPIELSEYSLRYRFGLTWTADIPLRDITSARRVDVAEVLDGNEYFMSPLGSTRNVVLEFDVPVQFHGRCMLRRSETRAAISLDDPATFLDELARRGVVIV